MAALIAEARAAGAASGANEGAPSAPPSRAPAVFDVHPRRPARRGLLLPDGSAVPFNADPTFEELEVPGATVVQPCTEPHTLCDGCFYVSGPIPRETSYEAGNPGHGAQWVRWVLAAAAAVWCCRALLATPGCVACSRCAAVRCCESALAQGWAQAGRCCCRCAPAGGGRRLGA